MWGKLVKCADILKFQFLWSVGSGSTINVATDPWITTLLLNVWPTYVNVDVDVHSLQVADWLTRDKQWDIPLKIPAPMGAWSDQLCWGCNRSYTVTSKISIK